MKGYSYIMKLAGENMEINANKYEPKDIIKIMRDSTNMTQEEFGKLVNKSSEWVKANEAGKTNYYFKDLLELAQKCNIEIIIRQK